MKQLTFLVLILALVACGQEKSATKDHGAISESTDGTTDAFDNIAEFMEEKGSGKLDKSMRALEHGKLKSIPLTTMGSGAITVGSIGLTFTPTVGTVLGTVRFFGHGNIMNNAKADAQQFLVGGTDITDALQLAFDDLDEENKEAFAKLKDTYAQSSNVQLSLEELQTIKAKIVVAIASL